MKRLLLCAALALAACSPTEGPPDAEVGSFNVELLGIQYTGAPPPAPVDVVTACATRYGGQDQVPAEARGTPDCPYTIDPRTVDITVKVTALDGHGQPLTHLNRPVSFRVVPGDLDGDYSHRWTMLEDGVATLTVEVKHVSGEVRLWAEDAPPQPIFDSSNGSVITDGAPPDSFADSYSHASGVSPAIEWEAPTLAKLQQPDDGTNKASPLVNQFVTVGRSPENGTPLVQSCPELSPGVADPNDGKEVTMLITGVDNAGFFITDLTACKQKEPFFAHSTPEPDGFLPGTYGSIYVYTSSFPDGLAPGDLLWTVAGSVQEFTSTTQLTFASWSIREDVRTEPPDQWNKYLDQVTPVELTDRTCGLENVFNPYITDILCGYNNANMKLESVESGLVQMRNVKFPETFKFCDFNGDASVPFFCAYQNAWTYCTVPDPDAEEQQCNIDCTVGQGDFAGKLCSEKSQYDGFGQFVVEMAGPGPASQGYDDTLSSRIQDVAVSATAQKPNQGYGQGEELRVWCDTAVHLRYGDGSVAATGADRTLAADTLDSHVLGQGESTVSIVTDGAGGTCHVARNPHVRILLTTQDAAPDLKVNCDENDPDGDAARQCRELHAARFDITGHLRQVQPARPRWQVLPRDSDDICCHPGPGLDCPKPIKACL